MDRILEEIKNFAEKAHGTQKRNYTPEPYIVHPVRVMKPCEEHNSTLPMLAAALLHDVLEDTPVSKEALSQYLLSIMKEEEAKQTMNLVIELTDIYTIEKYSYWN